MSLFIRDKNLFYFEKAGRIYEYHVPQGYDLREIDLTNYDFLNDLTLLREMDADMFYRCVDSDVDGTEFEVEEHNPQVVADADAYAIAKYNAKRLVEDINKANPTQPKLKY